MPVSNAFQSVWLLSVCLYQPTVRRINVKSIKPTESDRAWEHWVHPTHPDRWAITSLFCSQRSNATVVTIHTLNIQKRHQQNRLSVFWDNSTADSAPESQPRLFQLSLTLHPQHYIHKVRFIHVNLYAFICIYMHYFTIILCHSLLPVTSPSTELPLILPASHNCLIGQSLLSWSLPHSAFQSTALTCALCCGHSFLLTI